MGPCGSGRTLRYVTYYKFTAESYDEKISVIDQHLATLSAGRVWWPIL